MKIVIVRRYIDLGSRSCGRYDYWHCPHRTRSRVYKTVRRPSVCLSQHSAVARPTYASPSWRGFIKAEEIARLNAILSKARRFGYLPTDFHPLDDLLDASDESLFRSTRYNPQHVLHQLLPPPKQISYNLRSRGHGLKLSAIPSEFMRKNFLYRMLYNDIY